MAPAPVATLRTWRPVHVPQHAAIPGTAAPRAPRDRGASRSRIVPGVRSLVRSGAAPGRGARGSPIPPEYWRPPPVLSLCHTTRGHEATELGTWGGVRPGEHPCPMGGSCPSAPGVGGGTVPGHPLGHGVGDEMYGAGDVGWMAGDRGHMVRDKGHREGDVEYGAGGMGKMAGGTGHMEGEMGRREEDKGHRTWGGDVGRGHVPYGRAMGRGAYPQPCHLLGAQHPKVPAGRCCPPPPRALTGHTGHTGSATRGSAPLAWAGCGQRRQHQQRAAPTSPNTPQSPADPPSPMGRGDAQIWGPCRAPRPLFWGHPLPDWGGTPGRGHSLGHALDMTDFFWGGGNIFLALVGKYWRGWES